MGRGWDADSRRLAWVQGNPVGRLGLGKFTVRSKIGE